MRRLLNPSFAVALAALVVAVGGGAVATAQIASSDTPETVLRMRVTKDGKTIGTRNDGTVKKAGVGVYEITFSTGPTGSKVPLNLDDCAIVATPRVEHDSTQEEVAADVDVQRLGVARIFVETTRPVLGQNKIATFLQNASFDVAAIC
jgi:hypothetical protein